MAVSVEEHPLPPDTLGEPPKISLPGADGECAASTWPPTGPPITTLPPEK
jgi:hypothetical protein